MTDQPNPADFRMHDLVLHLVCKRMIFGGFVNILDRKG